MKLKHLQLLLGRLGPDFADGDFGTGVTPLLCAAAAGDTGVVGELLARGVDPNGTRERSAPLAHAARTDAPDAVRLLLDGGADARHRDPATGMTALHIAAGEDQPLTPVIIR